MSSLTRTRRLSRPKGRGWIIHFLIGAVTAAAVLYVGVYRGQSWVHNDFYSEALPGYVQLFAGHFGRFVQYGGPYIGSLILRAPFAEAAHSLGASAHTVYFTTALPCLLAVPALGAWLSVRTDLDRSCGRRVSPIVLLALNPLAIDAILLGHPEDWFGAALCVAAAELALTRRATMAGLLLGVALANKSWAIVAVVPVLAALPYRRRRALAAMLVTVGIVLIPVLVIRSMGTSAGGAASSFGAPLAGSTAFTGQLLWWFGGKSWLVQHGRYLLVLTSIAVGGIWWGLRRPSIGHPARRSELLLLVALVFLLRAALDPQDNLYYHVPFILAIMAYEVRRPARLTAFFSIALLLVVPPALLPVSPSVHALLYAVVALPTIFWLALRVLSPVPATDTSSGRKRVLVSVWSGRRERAAELR